MSLPKKVVIYIILVVTMAIATMGMLFSTQEIPGIGVLLFWGILAAATESLAILLPNGVGVSVGFAVSLASIIIGGPLMSALVSAIGVTFRVLKVKGKGYVHLFNSPAYKTIFNASQSIIVSAAAGMAYCFLGGQIGSFSPVQTLLILPVYVLINSAIMAKLFSLISNQAFRSIWVVSIKDVLSSALAVGAIGVIIALAYLAFGPFAVILFFAPLLLARYSFKLYMDTRSIYMETIQALNKSMEAKDAYTSGHAVRVQEYAVKLAEAMQLPDRKIQNIKTAAILHDIGKIGIDDNILKKPGSLTKDEYMEIQKHTTIGAEILKDVDFLKDISQIVRYHHERFDGKGYPNGLVGEQIPIEASILAVADVYDAMTSNRPYRNALDQDTALREILLNAGTQFDPKLAQTFCKVMGTRQVVAG